MSTKKTSQKKNGQPNLQKASSDINKAQYSQDMWRMIKRAFGEKPQSVNAQLTARTEYYKEILANMVKSRFKVTCPEWWSIDYMLNLLIWRGRFFIADSPFGVAPFNGSAHGLNLFERPSKVTIANHLLPDNMEKNIYYGAGSNVSDPVIAVYLYDDKKYRSMTEYIEIYAQRLASVDCSIDVNTLNTRLAYIFNVKNGKQANAAKKFYDKISLGEPAVFIDISDSFVQDSNSGKFVETMPAKENYIADKLCELKTDIKNEFLTQIGVNNTPYEKRERLLSNEVDSNNAELDVNTKYPRENLKRCSKLVRDCFGIDFNIELEEVEVEEYEADRLNGDSDSVRSES